MVSHIDKQDFGGNRPLRSQTHWQQNTQSGFGALGNMVCSVVSKAPVYEFIDCVKKEQSNCFLFPSYKSNDVICMFNFDKITV